MGIGTTNPDSSSILDIQSTDKGVLFPRVDLGATSIPNPARGLVVWNTDEVNGEINTGLYFWNGITWLSLVSNERLDTEIAAVETTGGWTEGGNTATNGDFIGTTNYVPLEFKVNNQTVGYIQPNGGMSLGKNANANENKSIAIGDEAKSSASNEAIAIGSNANASGYKSVALGASTSSSTNNAIAVGTNSLASGQNSVALGSGSSATAQNATAIGNNSVANQANTIILGNNSNVKVGIGTSNPSEKLQVNGSVKIVDGTQGQGKVLTSDANGKASWVAPPDVTYFGEIRKSSNSNLSQYSMINFGTTEFQQGVSANNSNFQIQHAGIYRVSFKLTIEKTNGSGSSNIGFFLVKGYSSSGLIPGSEVYANISAGQKITITGEKLIQLNAWEAVGVFSETSSNDVQILASGSVLNIERISG